jgi:hypothetical protein
MVSQTKVKWLSNFVMDDCPSMVEKTQQDDSYLTCPILTGHAAIYATSNKSVFH